MEKNMESDEDLLDRVKKALVGRYLTFVSQQTGLHYNTIWKIAHGKTTPSRDTLDRLSSHLFG
jgi:hypothetical protein